MKPTPGKKIRELIAFARAAAFVNEWDTAVRHATHALELACRELGVDHAETALPLGTLAWICAENGQYSLAEEYGHAALDLLVNTHQGDTQFAAMVRITTGFAMAAQGRAGAEPLMTRGHAELHPHRLLDLSGGLQVDPGLLAVVREYLRHTEAPTGVAILTVGLAP